MKSVLTEGVHYSSKILGAISKFQAPKHNIKSPGRPGARNLCTRNLGSTYIRAGDYEEYSTVQMYLPS
jgi:hypothetical protein